MSRPPWWDYDRACQSALRGLEHYRHEVDLRREVLDGYDHEALDVAAGLIQQCEKDLHAGDLGLLLTHYANLVKHLVWARHPVRDAEERRHHSRMAAKPGQPRSKHKQQAIAHYLATDPRPESREAWERMLDEAGIPYPSDGVGKWYAEARKLRDANRT